MPFGSTNTATTSQLPVPDEHTDDWFAFAADHRNSWKHAVQHAATHHPIHPDPQDDLHAEFSTRAPPAPSPHIAHSDTSRVDGNFAPKPDYHTPFHANDDAHFTCRTCERAFPKRSTVALHAAARRHVTSPTCYSCNTHATSQMVVLSNIVHTHHVACVPYSLPCTLSLAGNWDTHATTPHAVNATAGGGPTPFTLSATQALSSTYLYAETNRLPRPHRPMIIHAPHDLWLTPYEGR